MRIGPTTTYTWGAKFSDMATSLMARVKDLEDENECPKKMHVEEKLKV